MGKRGGEVARSQVILYIEDDDIKRYALGRLLKKAGFQVEEAASGSEGLNKISLCSPDLVLLDIGLPDIDGLTLCRILKGSEATAHVPILHISAAYQSASDRIAGLDNGADGYLTGVEDPEVILAHVRALLRLKQMTDALASQERSSKLLKHGKDQLQRFARNLLWDRDAERRELARKLNGSVRAKISDMAILLCTESECSSTGSHQRRKLGEGVNLARQALQELSSLARVLYAPELDVLGIEAALQDCARRFMNRTGVRAKLSISREVSSILDSEIAHAMLRTVEDGLDLIRQAHGTSAAIEARSAGEVLFLNLHGKNARYAPAIAAPRDERMAAAEALSIGLRERARHLGGFCGVVNGKDGMTIRAGFPLAGAGAEARASASSARV